MKFKLLALALGTAASISAVAMPMTLPGGPFFVQYSNAEQFSSTNSITGVTAAGGTFTEGNWGIIQVSIIQAGTAFAPAGSDIGGGGTTLFTNSQNGGNQITGIFYGAQTISGGYSTGGFLDLYWHDSSAVNVATELTSAVNLAKRTNQTTYTGFADASDPSMVFLGQFIFRPGCDPTHTYTICSPITPGTGNGTAQSYQDVNLAAGGLWAAQLDTNYFTLDANGAPMGAAGAADIRTNSNFYINGASAWTVAGTDIVGLRSNDPIVGVALPEPASLALVGLGLLGVGAIRRRRNS